MEHLNKAVALGAGRSGDELLDGCYFEVQDYEQALALDPEGQPVRMGR